MIDFLSLPKADVHLHFECMFDLDATFEVAERNGLSLPLSKSEFIYQRDTICCLSDIFSLIDLICLVPESAQDIHDMLFPYYERISSKNIVYVEPQMGMGIFPKLHTTEVIKGALSAASEAESNLNVKTNLIFMMTRGVENSRLEEIIQETKNYHHCFAGVGTAGHEFLNPASGIRPLFDLARNINLCRNNNATAHTGEEAPPSYVIETLHQLGVKRIDHGIRAQEDPALLNYLGRANFPLAMCPVSNERLKINENFCGGRFSYHKFVEAGCVVSVNSDDPLMTGADLDQVFREVQNKYGEEWPGGREGYIQLVKNGFLMGFMSENERKEYIGRIEAQARKEKDSE
jgi:adenine deaminase